MLPEHKWEILVHSGAYYPDLTMRFRGNDMGLYYEDDHLGLQFFANSYHIDELDDPKQVARRLFSLELLLNGSLRIAWNEIVPSTKFNEFSSPGEGPIHSLHASNIEEYPFSKNFEIDNTQHQLSKAQDYLPSHIFNLCKKDDAIRSIAFQIGLISIQNTLETIMTWGTLYKVYDSVKHYSRIYKYDFEYFTDVRKLNQFTAACNNSAILGVYARHGEKGWQEPETAMNDINKAINLIIDLAHNFCVHHIKAQHL